MADNEDGFLSRWSRRKVQVQQGLPVAPEPALVAPLPASLPMAAPAPAAAVSLPGTDDPLPAAAQAEPEAEPLPTLEDALQLTPTSADFSRFVGRGVAPQVQHTALKTLFSDPHFNVMDRLDTYIDDYNTPDPLPAGMLRKMVQSTLLGLFDDEDKPKAAVPGPAPTTESMPRHEDPAVRLQPNDDARPPGDQPGLVEDPGRQL